MLARRIFLRGSAIVMAGAGPAPFWLRRATAAAQTRRKILVAIFQRGAADGLNIVVPFADKRYYELRPTLAIPAPNGSGATPSGASPVFSPGGGAIDLDGRFGLNPALRPLKDLWDRQTMAIVIATGSPDPSRSHFDAQEYMESGTPGMKRDGWLNRALTPVRADDPPLRAIAAGATLPRTLQGDNPAIAVGNGQQLGGGRPVPAQIVAGVGSLPGGMVMNNGQRFHIGDDTAAIVESMYVNSRDAQLATAGKNAFAAMRTIESLNRTPYRPSSGAQYGAGGELGFSLQQIARLIKADVGVEAAFAEIGGWDHHQNEPQQLNNVLRQFGSALAAFSTDMGDRMEDIVLVTMSEFGRTAQENGNNGTDHGHGNVMFVLGGPVRGGRIYGKWPGLEREQLYEGRDLAVTTDFRAVLSELVAGQLGTSDLEQVFPGYASADRLNLLG